VFVIATSAAELGACLRRRARRALPAAGDRRPPGATVALRQRLFVSGSSGARAFRGRAVAVSVGDVEAGGPTRYLVDDAGRGERVWIAEHEIERSAALGPGDAVIGYVTVRDGGRPGATREPRAAIRRACAREGWRLIGVVCDDGRCPVPERPGLRGALDRIGDGTAAGLVVADLDEAGGSNRALAELLGAVRGAGGGTVALAGDDAAPTDRRRVALADARARIAELRAAGASPRAIADTLNEEGVPTVGADSLWRPWSVREAGGAWPPRGPARRRPRP
jgi:Resolvase, N terminal domain